MKPPDGVSDELERLRKENTILRGLVQRNPEWKCTYGYLSDGKPLKTMGQCPLGFPGCNCADDLLCAEEEAARSGTLQTDPPVSSAVAAPGNSDDKRVPSADALSYFAGDPIRCWHEARDLARQLESKLAEAKRQLADFVCHPDAQPSAIAPTADERNETLQAALEFAQHALKKRADNWKSSHNATRRDEAMQCRAAIEGPIASLKAISGLKRFLDHRCGTDIKKEP